MLRAKLLVWLPHGWNYDIDGPQAQLLVLYSSIRSMHQKAGRYFPFSGQA